MGQLQKNPNFPNNSAGFTILLHPVTNIGVGLQRGFVPQGVGFDNLGLTNYVGIQGYVGRASLAQNQGPPDLQGLLTNRSSVTMSQLMAADGSSNTLLWTYPREQKADLDPAVAHSADSFKAGDVDESH